MSDNASRALTAAGSAPAEIAPAGVPAGIRLKRRVTNELLKMVEGATYIVRIDGPIYQAQAETSRRAPAAADGAPKKAPPMLALVSWVTADQDGTVLVLPRQIIVPAVLQGELEKTYPDNGYVGKAFALQKFKIQGKLYNGFDIAEVELPPMPAAEDEAPVVRGRRSRG